MFLNDKELVKFASNISINDNGCWEWTAYKTEDGYGRFWLRRLFTSPQCAHRVSYQQFIGDIGDKFVCHECDNPPCVNPKHLFLGTPHDNMVDMYNKERHISCPPESKGEKNGMAKLTEESVLEIIELLDSFNNIELGKRYNVTHSTISLIRRKKTWKHLLNTKSQ